MSVSSTEFSFLRLLERTKKLSREDLCLNKWKVRAAATLLGTLLSTMQDERGMHNADVLVQYGREVNQLTMLVEAELKKTSEEKLLLLDRIPRTFPEVDVLTSPKKEDSLPSAVHTESAAGIRLRNRAVYKADLRQQLLGEDHRIKAQAHVQDLSHQEGVQEDISNDILSFAKQLKQNATIAGNVIREDNQRLTKMSTVVESNRDKLGAESQRLAHHAYKCGFDCMLVVIAIFIFSSFIAMVLVMKIFPKRVTS